MFLGNLAAEEGSSGERCVAVPPWVQPRSGSLRCICTSVREHRTCRIVTRRGQPCADHGQSLNETIPSCDAAGGALSSLVVGRVRDQCGQARKGTWGMSWRPEAKKGVEDCEKPGEAVKRALIPGYPNRHPLNP